MSNYYPDTSVREAEIDRAPRPRVWLRLSLMLLVVGLLAAGLIGFHAFKARILRHVTAGIQSEQPTVATAKAALQPWQASLSTVGTLRASNGTDISPEIGGVIDAVDFDTGQTVPAGAVLAHLRLNDDSAKLAQLQAAAALDAITLQRDQRQLAAKGVARSTVDTDIANLRVARAQVEAQQAVINEKTIRAPFAGRLGVRQIDLGQYVAAGTALVTLQALDPMFVDFYLPQRAVGDIKPGGKVVVTVDAYPGKSFAGIVVSANSKVDSSSRMLEVRATIANRDGALLPGMFANVSVDTGKPQMLVTIPQTAVAYNPYGSLVYVIHKDAAANGTAQAKAYQHFVTTGAARGDQVSILHGLRADEQVVTAGQMKLHNAAAVKIDNSVTMPDAATAAPQDQ
jgi:membrane fusion protein (multidrug efflux system)